jgi:hypothetical protein
MDDKQKALKEQLMRQVQDAAAAHRAGPVQRFMSGRWLRRDGNVYGVLTQNDQQAKNANSQAGNLRSTPVRRD